MNLRGVYIVSVILCMAQIAFAQPPYSSRSGKFTVDQEKGCTGLVVNITISPGNSCSPQNLFPCGIDWGDGPPPPTFEFSHTYTQPGTYLLRVLIQSQPIDDIQITVLPSI